MMRRCTCVLGLWALAGGSGVAAAASPPVTTANLPLKSFMVFPFAARA